MRLEYRYALYLFLAESLWLCLEYWLGLHDRYIERYAYYSMIGYLVPVFGLWAALRAKKKELGGQMRFGIGVKTGTVISLILAPLNGVFAYFFFSQVSPYLEQATAFAIRNGLSEAQAKGYFDLSFYLLQVFFGTIIAGVLISAGVSSILKTRPTRA